MRFKVASRVLQLGTRKGKTVYYAMQQYTPRTSWSSLEQRIVSHTGISRPDIRAALTALADIMLEELGEGRSVDFADLGSFRIIASGKMMDSFDAVDAQTVRTPKVIFYPRMRTREVASNVSLEVLKVAHAKSTKPKGSKPGATKPDAGGTHTPGSGTPGQGGGSTPGGGSGVGF